MKAIKICFFILLLGLNFYSCEKRAVPPESNQLSFPPNFRAASGFHSIALYWTALQGKEISGYRIYYGTTSKTYSDTLLVDAHVSSAEIKNLKQDQRYYFAISTVGINNKESELSDELSLHTYLAYEDFSQPEGKLDTTKWHYEVGYSVPVVNESVAATDIQFNDVRMRRSFGQYLLATPADSFAVECEFKLGTPNVGGAGLMIRAEKANPERYYKGYNAFIFWNFNNWELRLEESLVDRMAMQNAVPVKLPDIRPDEWIKLTMSFTKNVINASVFRLSGYSLLATISAADESGGRRPTKSDTYCGFFTTQYGGNIIYTDNFGIRRLD